ncbi:hypothetical protein SAMN02745172_01468 [Pseudoxanthobacter soli DSM 19599]|uniref:DUF1150 domain-containing protein n=1 Tax=Pseudoxanthobacter soli DSM 19599 TaxID=1123029 RepID=A0A1M7ZFI4_9HYPH|nr:DUF1150 domain-containing protein [Pseudoxanthobacter soli]SHO63602.1 hypothetical protein SAMN02745172_01468 [Pseudoxanthobacter soli DSM 19599]
MNTENRPTRTVPPEILAGIGAGRLTYVKSLTSAEVPALFPQAPELSPDLELWALLGADGTPILLTDSREAAIANAAEHDMVTVSVH